MPLDISSLPQPTEENLRLIKSAAACAACGGHKLCPVTDGQQPPVIAIACDDCGEIEGDGPTLAAAVQNWNRLSRNSRQQKG
jgi:hypothetical protein